MLQLKNICKEYRTGDLVQKALDNVILNLRDSEFVAILGPSGSGKTTLLNVVGGLDRYDSGDLIINGVSTKKYRERDWDSYRNHTIGFVFQSYNLIMHQSVLANVELALTISGISGSERRRRAEEALQKVGLGDQIHKRPAQMSGGQMQRVAIARALVNDPDIVLADEPTGALDSDTSIQVMDLLKEVARDRLVVMVTHNPELAGQYATRIVTIKDGRIKEDSDPYIVNDNEEEEPVYKRLGRASMSFFTALGLSFNNLRTKKARTFLVSFAGSIGIIGIAMILALSNGANRYIQTQEEETLAQYPLQIERTGYDLTSFMSGSSDSGGTVLAGQSEAVQDRVAVQDIVDRLFSGVSTNDLESLKKYLDSDGGGISQYVNGIEYDYDVTPRIYRMDGDEAVQLNPNDLFDSLATGQIDVSSMMSGTLGSNFFYSLPVSESLYMDTYEVKAGHWPEKNNELVLVLNQNGEISDLLLYELGIRDETKLQEKIEELSDSASGLSSGGSAGASSDEAVSGSSVSGSENVNSASAVSESAGSEEAVSGSAQADSSSSGEEESYSYDTFLGMKFKLVNNSDLYEYDSDMGIWTDRSDDTALVNRLASGGRDLEITGIVQPKQEIASSALDPGIAYPYGLITDIIKENGKSRIVEEQTADRDKNVLTGNSFSEDNENSGFDLSKLITVDEDAIADAFDINTDDLKDMDLGGIADGLDSSSLGLDGGGTENTDIGSVIDINGLRSALPSLSADDISGLAGQIKITGTSDQLLSLFKSVVSGFEKYSSADPSTDYSKLGDSLKDYLESDGFRDEIRSFLTGILNENSDAVITEDDLRQMISPLITGYIQYMMQQPEMQDPARIAEYAEDPSKLAAFLTDPSNIEKYLSDQSSGAAGLLASAASEISEKIKQINISDEELKAEAEKILEGYDDYAESSGAPKLSALPEAFGNYLQTDEAKQMIIDAAEGMVDTGGLEKAISDRLQKTVSAAAGNLEKQISAAVTSVMNSVSANIAAVLQKAMENYSQTLTDNMGSMFTIDPDALADVIKFNMNAGQIQELLTSMVSGNSNSYEDNLSKFGYADMDDPSSIQIYSKDFDSKNHVTDILDAYNKKAEDDGEESRIIHYTDMISAMMSSVTRIINAISTILIGFVAISLIVSSIMIGVITYISVLERRKEIGILRAMGASKHNVAQVFNAETFITGMLAGIIGVAVTVILTYPADIVIRRVTGIEGIHAVLPPAEAGLLVLLSVVLTMIAGLIPAGKASRSDPVAALRNE